MTNIAGITAMEDLKDLLQLTPNIKPVPVVKLIYEEKSTGMINDAEENIFIKYDGENIDYFLHGDDTWHTVQLSVDIWTRTSIDRLNDIVSAVFGYIKTNVRFLAPNTKNQYADMMVVGNHPQSDQYRGIFRHVIDVQLRRINP